MKQKKPEVDPAWEASRGDLRRQAQEWAGLKVDPEAELFVFVGRWSLQKGVSHESVYWLGNFADIF